MEGDFQQRTPQHGKVMFPTHQMEARDAKHEEGPPESKPPAAKGDRPPAEEPDRELIAHRNRPSFLQLLTALWGAEDELEQKRGNKTPKRKRPQPKDTKQEEKP